MKNNRCSLFIRQYQIEIALWTTLAMVLGFLCGRAILSVAMFLFSINAFWNQSVRNWFQKKWWLLGLSWTLIYVISFYWSSDIPYWHERVMVKLPFLTFTLGFACLPAFKQKHIKFIYFGIGAMLIAACCYSLSFLMGDPKKVLDGYYFAKVLPTPAYKDHIRFSVFVAWFVIWSFFMYRKMNEGIQKAISIALILFMILFLHILAVRSGLLVLYTFVLCYFFYLLLNKRFVWALSLFAGFCLSCIILYQSVPSLRAKIGYVRYTYAEYKKGNINADFSDMGRLISYDLAFKIIKEHPLIGVGAGDVRAAMKEKYEQFSPKTKPEQRIVPHNQILEVTLAGGLLTLIPFLIWLCYPLKQLTQSRAGFYVFSVWLGLFVSMMVEPMLEVQFGVFVYLFCLLWTLKTADLDNENGLLFS